MKVRLVSWNVLNLVHERKYNPKSEILSKYENKENQRLLDIISVIKNNIHENTIIALQECFEELYTQLFNEFSTTFDLFNSKNKEDNDFLVILAPKQLNLSKEMDHPSHQETSYGYLIISNTRVRIVNCHLRPQFACSGDIFEPINQLNSKKDTIVMGDFNTERRYMLKSVKYNYFVPFFGITYKRRCIDNIITNFIPSNYHTHNVNINMISDHNLIYIDFTR